MPGPRSGWPARAGCASTAASVSPTPAAKPASPTPRRRTLARPGAVAGRLAAPLRDRWEAVNNAWNQHILGYDPQRQRELLSPASACRLRLAQPGPCSAGRSLLVAAMTAWTLYQRPAIDRPASCGSRCLRQLAKTGNCALAETRWHWRSLRNNARNARGSFRTSSMPIFGRYGRQQPDMPCARPSRDCKMNPDESGRIFQTVSCCWLVARPWPCRRSAASFADDPRNRLCPRP